MKITFEIDEQGGNVIKQIDQQLTAYALEKFNGKCAPAARWLGITNKGLYLKRIRFELPVREYKTGYYDLDSEGAREMWRRYPDE